MRSFHRKFSIKIPHNGKTNKEYMSNKVNKVEFRNRFTMEKETAEKERLNHKRCFVLVALCIAIETKSILEHFQRKGKTIHIEKNK